MNISYGSGVSGAVVCPNESGGEEPRVERGCGGGEADTPVSSAHLAGHMLSHISFLGETLVYIHVARLSKVFFQKLFNFGSNTQVCSATRAHMFSSLFHADFMRLAQQSPSRGKTRLIRGMMLFFHRILSQNSFKHVSLNRVLFNNVCHSPDHFFPPNLPSDIDLICSIYFLVIGNFYSNSVVSWQAMFLPTFVHVEQNRQ